MRTCYLYDYHNHLPIAECSNVATSSNFAYTSFEAEGQGYWHFIGTTAWDSTAPTGLKSYDLNQSEINYVGSLLEGMDYFVTYWSNGKGSDFVNGSPGTRLFSKNGWSLYQHKVPSGTESVTVSGTAYIDELRLYPANSALKTYCYLPEIGMISTADANNTYLRYIYDGYDRLYQVKDWDGNIIKKMEYAYGAAIQPCANTASNWQATGNTRCAKNNVVNNANTGYREREELDSVNA